MVPRARHYQQGRVSVMLAVGTVRRKEQGSVTAPRVAIGECFSFERHVNDCLRGSCGIFPDDVVIRPRSMLRYVGPVCLVFSLLHLDLV